jgi:kynureninase
MLPNSGSDFTALFSRALASAPGRIHLAAHSHHLWPDVTFEAHMQAWSDAAALADTKWDKIFGEIIPKASKLLSQHLGSDAPESIVFSPNTHDFILRLLSCLPSVSTLKILTTDGEFHSFERQSRRLEEAGAKVVRVPVEPRKTFAERLLAAAKTEAFDLVFFSQVFFRSGWVVPNLANTLVGLDAAVPQSTFIVVDGYHGYFAVPTDLREMQRRVFYLSGGYKYLMSGEGVCFMHCPKGYGPRPTATGWFASFGALQERNDKVGYTEDGGRFWGSTMDPSGLYRLASVLELCEQENISVARARSHAASLAEQFHSGLVKIPALPFVPECAILTPQDQARGRFMTYRFKGATDVQATLLRHNIITDVRDDHLRFGFGLYQNQATIQGALERIAKIEW